MSVCIPVIMSNLSSSLRIWIWKTEVRPGMWVREFFITFRAYRPSSEPTITIWKQKDAKWRDCQFWHLHSIVCSALTKCQTRIHFYRTCTVYQLKRVNIYGSVQYEQIVEYNGIPDQSVVKYSWYPNGHHPPASVKNFPTVSEYETEREMKIKNLGTRCILYRSTSMTTGAFAYKARKAEALSKPVPLILCRREGWQHSWDKKTKKKSATNILVRAHSKRIQTRNMLSCKLINTHMCRQMF